MSLRPTLVSKLITNDSLLKEFNCGLPIDFPVIDDRSTANYGQVIDNPYVPDSPIGNLKVINWQPEQFPQGTVIEVDCTDLLTVNADATFTVNKVVRNGPNSYVVETTTPWLSSVNINRSFHLSRVVAIRTPGKGKVVIDNGHFGINKTTWLRSYLSTLVPYYVSLDHDKFCNELEKRFRRVKSCSIYGRFTSSPAAKKRIKRWAKQNINRFLLPVKRAQLEYDEFMWTDD